MYPNLDFWFENKPSGNPVFHPTDSEDLKEFEWKKKFSDTIFIPELCVDELIQKLHKGKKLSVFCTQRHLKATHTIII
jgi:hypothetical protein